MNPVASSALGTGFTTPNALSKTTNNSSPKEAAEKPSQPLRYHWENGTFKLQQEPKSHSDLKRLGALPFKREHLRGGAHNSDIGGVYIKFLIRSPADPTGSNSPCIHVDGDVPLWEVFNWYIANTYAHGPFMPPLEEKVEDYCLMKIDMAKRTLGKKYHYAHAQESPLKIMDTEWWVNAELTKLCVVSNDRIPKGDYKPCES